MKKQAQHLLKGDIILYEIILKSSLWDAQPPDTLQTSTHPNEVLEDALVDGRATVLTYKSHDGSIIIKQFPSDYPFDIKEEGGYKILGALWFTNPTIPRQSWLDLDNDPCIGVVAVETYTDQWKAYTGVGGGSDSRADEQRIARAGSGLSAWQARGFFPHLDINKYKRD